MGNLPARSVLLAKWREIPLATLNLLEQVKNRYAQGVSNDFHGIERGVCLAIFYPA